MASTTIRVTSSLSLASTLVSLLLFPLLISASVLLIPLALVTTCISISALTFRATLLYAELIGALAWHHLGLDESERERQNFTKKMSKRAAAKDSRPSGFPHKRRTELSQARLNASASAHLISSPNPQGTSNTGDEAPGPSADALPLRDYEGIGGWTTVDPGPPSSEHDAHGTGSPHLQWIKLNSRLELPSPDPMAGTKTKSSDTSRSASHQRKGHERSAISGSIGLAIMNWSLAEPRCLEDETLQTGTGTRTKSMVLLKESIPRIPGADADADEHEDGEDTLATRRRGSTGGRPLGRVTGRQRGREGKDAQLQAGRNSGGGGGGGGGGSSSMSSSSSVNEPEEGLTLHRR